MTTAQTLRIWSLHDKGWMPREIAHELGMETARVKRALIWLGQTPRTITRGAA